MSETDPHLIIQLDEGYSATNEGMVITNVGRKLAVTAPGWSGIGTTNTGSSEIFVGGPGAENGETTVYKAVG